jgi:hypothetical protein
VEITFSKASVCTSIQRSNRLVKNEPHCHFNTRSLNILHNKVNNLKDSFDEYSDSEKRKSPHYLNNTKKIRPVRFFEGVQIAKFVLQDF